MVTQITLYYHQLPSGEGVCLHQADQNIVDKLQVAGFDGEAEAFVLLISKLNQQSTRTVDGWRNLAAMTSERDAAVALAERRTVRGRAGRVWSVIRTFSAATTAHILQVFR